MPPSEGPRATLWVTRQPMKQRTEPSSILVGIKTSTDFLHSPRIPTMSSSRPKTPATFRSCCCAIRNGLSGTVMGAGGSLYPEGDLQPARRAAERRQRDQADLVASGRERRTPRATSRQAEAVDARKEVAGPGEGAEIATAGGVEQHVEPRHGLDRDVLRAADPAGDDRERGGRARRGGK